MATRQWWQDGVIYQVYPRSFQDSTGDGVGDLRGILARLDYLVELGVDALWVSPFYPSPMADFGYDVADYCDVDPLFGTLADFDALLAGAHARGLKLILDFVPNHSSDQHPWFLESRSSRTNPKRDWYLWRDAGPDGAPPNNWISHFGGPAWTWDELTRQFYYHSFLIQQPDLNWRNPEVRQAMYDAMRFWLGRGENEQDEEKRGVDGFRMDVLWLLIKDDQFRSNPLNSTYSGGNEFRSTDALYTADRPETQEIVREMRTLLESYGERVLIGEIYLPIEQLVTYYGASAAEVTEVSKVPKGLEGLELRGAQMPFNFHLILANWEAEAICGVIRHYEAALPPGAWPNWVLGNHDQKRLASRVGTDQARVAAMLLLTLRGTPTMYYGDELGMLDAQIPASEVVDPAEKNQPGLGLGRDPERSPMLWDNRENAGFTSPGVKTWLPLAWDWPKWTVETESDEPRSVLALYRRLLQLRRQHPALHAGSVSEVRALDGVLSFVRGQGEFELHLNLTAEVRWVQCRAGRILLSTSLDEDGQGVSGWVRLRGDEGVLIELFSQ